jgi:hypothetical protein
VGGATPGVFNPYTQLAVGLMKIENLIRCAPRAVGVNPSAMQGKARLRELAMLWG